MNLCLTLSMLKLILPKAKELEDFRKPSKPCHVGIHLNALKEYPCARVSVIFQVFLDLFVLVN